MRDAKLTFAKMRRTSLSVAYLARSTFPNTRAEAVQTVLRDLEIVSRKRTKTSDRLPTNPQPSGGSTLEPPHQCLAFCVPQTSGSHNKTFFFQQEAKIKAVN